jgi:hypothetical protein
VLVLRCAGDSAVPRDGLGKQRETNMKHLVLVLALTLVALAFQVSTVTAEHWCGGVYDEKVGTSFGQCPGPKH